MIEALGLDILAATAFTGIGLAVRSAAVARKRAIKARIPAVPRSIKQLPYRHRGRARLIATIARECLGRHQSGSFEAFTAREALDSYLPQTLEAYLAVPRMRRRVSPGPGRPSADDELRRQLRTIRRGLEQIQAADAEAAVAAMTVNGNFLNQRFGQAIPIQTHATSLLLIQDVVDSLSALFRRT